MATSAAPLRPTALVHIEDFEPLQPDTRFLAREEPGMTDYPHHKPPLGFLPAEGNLPFVDLPEKLKQLMDHCWKSAKASAGQRGPLQIGGSTGRTNHIPNMLAAVQPSRTPANIFEARRIQDRNANYVKQIPAFSPPAMTAPQHLQGTHAEDWATTNQLQRVNAYTFRGDRRTVEAVHAAGGFYPPISRTDKDYVEKTIYPTFNLYMQRRYGIQVSLAEFYAAYRNNVATEQQKVILHGFFAWKSLVDNETYHVGRMLASETLKGFISTTRAVTVAKGFAADNGWVYVTLVQGGFLVPDKGKHVWTQVFGEQEIALPAPVPWSNVFGFRRVHRLVEGGVRFVGPVYLRRKLQAKNPKVHQECYELLSGRVQ